MPVNRLFVRCNFLRLARLPNSAGISPVRSFMPSHNSVRLARLPNSGGISPLNRRRSKDNDDTPSSPIPTSSHSLIGKSGDQFILRTFAPDPSSVVFMASSVAQSAIRPGLSAGFGTATPLEHCSVNWAGMSRALSDMLALKALAVGASARNPIATAMASAVRAANEIALAYLMLNRRTSRISCLICMYLRQLRRLCFIGGALCRIPQRTHRYRPVASVSVKSPVTLGFHVDASIV